MRLKQKHRALHNGLKSWAFYLGGDRNGGVSKVHKFEFLSKAFSQLHRKGSKKKGRETK